MNRINVLRRLVIVAGIMICWPDQAIPEHDPFAFARPEKIFPGRPAPEMPPKSKDDEGWLAGTGNMYQLGLDPKHGNWWTGNVDSKGKPLPTYEEITQAKFSTKIREVARDGHNEYVLPSLLRKQQQVRNAKQALPSCEGLSDLPIVNFGNPFIIFCTLQHSKPPTYLHHTSKKFYYKAI